MNWKLNGDGPVYQQIMDVLRSAVLSGTFAPGERIPSVRELSAEARVNPNTMQRALWELEREGLLVSQGTMGRLVTDDQQILQALRQKTLERLARECIEKFRALGVTQEEAAEVLARLGEREEHS